GSRGRTAPGLYGGAAFAAPGGGHGCPFRYHPARLDARALRLRGDACRSLRLSGLSPSPARGDECRAGRGNRAALPADPTTGATGGKQGKRRGKREKGKGERRGSRRKAKGERRKRRRENRE